MYCKNCGNYIDENAKFCEMCGHKTETNTITQITSNETITTTTITTTEPIKTHYLRNFFIIIFISTIILVLFFGILFKIRDSQYSLNITNTSNNATHEISISFILDDLLKTSKVENTVIGETINK